MHTFVYPARFERGEKPGVVVITFRDLSEAITQGKGKGRALAGGGLPGRGDRRQDCRWARDAATVEGVTKRTPDSCPSADGRKSRPLSRDERGRNH